MNATPQVACQLKDIELSGEINKEQLPKVLVVDDLSDNLMLMSLSLQHMGYDAITATNGVEAVEVALQARPDLILMDIAMPELDGLGATRRIREHVELANTPIIAVTAFNTGDFRGAAYDAGFDGYITKPIDFERLSKLISNLLSRKSAPEK